MLLDYILVRRVVFLLIFPNKGVAFLNNYLSHRSVSILSFNCFSEVSRFQDKVVGLRWLNDGTL